MSSPNPSTESTMQVIEAQRQGEDALAFNLPVNPADISKIEAVDLDLLLTTANGQQFILPQGALLAMTQPNSALRFANGEESLASDAIKRVGVLKPVENGSFRLAGLDFEALQPEKVQGTGFGLGQEIEDVVSKLDTSSQRMEQILQTLDQVTQAAPVTQGDEPPPSTQTGVKRTTKLADPNPFASPTPGAPPQPENDNTSDNDAIPKVTFALLAADKAGVTHLNVALGKTEIRQLIGKSSLDLNMGAGVGNLTMVSGMVENQLVLSSAPTTTSLILNINNQQPGFRIPDGLTINGQAITPGTPLNIDVTGMQNNEVPLNLKWNEGTAAANSDFQMTVKYIGPTGEVLLKTISFTGNAQNAYTLDSNGETRLFIASTADNLVINANDAANTITTGNGNDTIKGSGGADTINGGAGKDTVDYSASTAAVTVNVSSGAGTGGQAQGDQLSNIEVLTGSTQVGDTLDFSGASTGVTANLITGTSNQKLNGSDSVENLTFSGFENVVGSAKDDRFVASSAVNDFKGGARSDTVDYSNSAAVVVNLHTGKGFDNHAAGDTYDSIENLIGGAGNDTFFASEAANSFTGNGGVNRVNYEHYTKDVNEHSTEGVTINLFTGQGSGGFAEGDRYATIQNATGSRFDDTFVASNLPNDFVGGAGTDTVSYANSTGAVTVNLLNNTGTGATGTDAVNDRYTEIENAIGGAGNDTFISGTGANRFDGGGGNNTVSYAGSTAVNANLGTTGAASGGNAAGDTFINIQNLTGGAGNDTLTGDANANVLTGGAGADTLIGGDGNDTVSFSNVTSTTVSIVASLGMNNADGSASGDGTDVLRSIENLIGGAGADTLTGNEQDNVLNGGAGADTLIGGAGNDTLIGGDGSDTVSFSNVTSTTVSIVASLGMNNADGSASGDGTDVLRSIENLIGGAGTDTLTGNEQANVLNGGAGADILIGGAGNDTLIGGEGNDVLDLRRANTSLDGDRAHGEKGDDTVIISQSQNTGNVFLNGGEGVDTLQVWGTSGGSLNLLNILDLNAENFEKLDVSADPGAANVLISSAGISKLVTNTSGVDVLSVKLASNDTYTIASEPNISVTHQSQSVSFYNGAIAPANLVAQVNFEYA